MEQVGLEGRPLDCMGSGTRLEASVLLQTSVLLDRAQISVTLLDLTIRVDEFPLFQIVSLQLAHTFIFWL